MGSLSGKTIAVVGATGAVGAEMLGILAERGVPDDRVRAVASSRSAGREMAYGEGLVTVTEVTRETFGGVDIALFAASSDLARELAPVAIEAGADVVDNSSAFRMDTAVPLVTPEVNADAIPDRSKGARLIANPNCSTIMLLMAVTPLYRAFGCRRLVVSTYQAVSGAGAAAMDELRTLTTAALAGEDANPTIFSESCAFNVFSHDSPLDPTTGRNKEEQKMLDETRKIWNDASVEITATCVRVPVFRAHTESINIELAEPATVDEVRGSIVGFAGVEIVDDRAANRFPTPLKAAHGDAVLVGRIRPDGSAQPDANGRYRRFDLMCSGDQIRKGAALNAVQIAELL